MEKLSNILAAVSMVLFPVIGWFAIEVLSWMI